MSVYDAYQGVLKIRRKVEVDKSMDVLISVIVPIYNNEQWIPTCIESIRKQTYTHLEILIIDDGSEITVAKLCDVYAEVDKRIRVYHIKNGGVSKARNEGLKYATGQYVVFVDSDDYLEPDIINKALQWQLTHNEYLCKWNMATFGENAVAVKHIVTYTHSMNMIRWKASIISGNFGADIGISIRTVWGGLFCLKIIKDNNIRFIENLYIGEDAVFVLEYIKFTKGMTFLETTGYYYRIHTASAARRYKTDLYEQFTRELKGLTDSLTFEEKREKHIRVAITGFTWNRFNFLINNNRKGCEQNKVLHRDILKEPLKWIDVNKKYIHCGHMRIKTVGKMVFAEYILSYFVPIKVIGLLVLWWDILKGKQI